MRFTFGNKTIFDTDNVNTLLFLMLSFLSAVSIAYTYAASSRMVYGFVIITVMIISYALLLFSIGKSDLPIQRIVCFILIVSFFNGLLRLKLFDALRVNLSIIIPIGISTLNLKKIEEKKTWYVPALLTFACIFVLMNSQLGRTTASLNENSIAFLGYMSISLGFFWFKLSKVKLLPLAYLFAGYTALVVTQCRNLILVLPICLILLLLPTSVWKGKVKYRAIYLCVLLYTVLASQILKAFFSSSLYPSLKQYVDIFAEGKTGSMVSRSVFFDEVIRSLSALPWYEKLIGQGIRGNHHGHNIFYQCRYIYGYIGTGLVYIVFIRVFEMARVLIKEKGDMIALCCVITLIGHFILNGADLYLVGTDCIAVMPQVMMGIIMSRYRQFQKEEHLLNEIDQYNYSCI